MLGKSAWQDLPRVKKGWQKCLAKVLGKICLVSKRGGKSAWQDLPPVRKSWQKCLAKVLGKTCLVSDLPSVVCLWVKKSWQKCWAHLDID